MKFKWSRATRKNFPAKNYKVNSAVEVVSSKFYVRNLQAEVSKLSR